MRDISRALIEKGGERLAVNIPCGMFHAAVAFSTGAVAFEAKAGPYSSHTPEEKKAGFAPAEGAPAAHKSVQQPLMSSPPTRSGAAPC